MSQSAESSAESSERGNSTAAQGPAAGGRLRRIGRFIGGALTWATGIHLVSLAVLLGFFEWHTRPDSILETLLFLPTFIWLLPLVVLMPLSLVFRPVLLIWHLLAVLGVVFGYMHFKRASEFQLTGPGLTVITTNIGERKTRTLWPFLEREQADVVAYQDAVRHGAALTSENPDRFVAIEGEFILVSKYPVTDSGVVRGLEHQGRPVVAWFELNYEGRPVVIYSVHMPTPRPHFAKLRGRGFAAELFRGGGIRTAAVRQEYAEYWSERFRLAQDLVAVLDGEKRPFLVVGDFNMPDHGCLYAQFEGTVTDAFAVAGRGWGFTFPGVTHNPVALFRPWLRLDYLFASTHWKPLYCRVEPPQPAQHRAVVARFEFREAE